MRFALLLAAALTLATFTAQVSADAGDWLIRAGITNIDPDDDGGDFADTDLEFQVASTASISTELTYMFTDNIGLELLAAYPFEHDISIESLGEIGDAKHLPPTLSLQWHFTQFGAFKPYIGAGVNWTYFFDEDTRGAVEGADLDLDDSWGAAFQVGVDYNITDKWFINGSVRYIMIETTAEVDGTDVGDVTIDPWLLGAHVGYRF
jgi:outer membrane protein